MDRLCYDRKDIDLAQEVIRVVKINKKKTLMAKAYVVVRCNLLYEIWCVRCKVVFRHIRLLVLAISLEVLVDYSHRLRNFY